MGIRTAVHQAPRVTYAVVFALLWVVLIGYEVATGFDWLAFGGSFVGRNATAGVLGVLVLALGAALLIALLGELGEAEPAPDPWPPEE